MLNCGDDTPNSHVTDIVKYVFIKFGKRQHLESLLDGHLYMNILKYFVDLEKETGCQGVGDIREASLINIVKHELSIKIGDGKWKSIPIGPPPGIIYDESALHHPVFCLMRKIFYWSWNASENAHFGKIALSSDECKDFMNPSISPENEYALVIFKPISFLNRVVEKATSSGMDINAGPITYRDRKIPKIQNGHLILDNTFDKDLRFKNQHEYRIELLKSFDEAMTLDIQPIKDISFMMNISSLLNGITLRVATNE